MGVFSISILIDSLFYLFDNSVSFQYGSGLSKGMDDQDMNEAAAMFITLPHFIQNIFANLT
jgi:hypothetical protein